MVALPKIRALRERIAGAAVQSPGAVLNQVLCNKKAILWLPKLNPKTSILTFLPTMSSPFQTYHFSPQSCPTLRLLQGGVAGAQEQLLRLGDPLAARVDGQDQLGDLAGFVGAAHEDGGALLLEPAALEKNQLTKRKKMREEGRKSKFPPQKKIRKNIWGKLRIFLLNPNRFLLEGGRSPNF